MRYCSGRRIAPATVSESVVDEFMAYRHATTALATDAAARRAVARAWNSAAASVEGWPTQRLLEPPLKAVEGPRWEDFPAGLQCDVDQYLAGLTRVRRNAKGRRVRPCSPTTIRTRRAVLVATARMAVQVGIPIERLVSLAALLHPTVIERVVDSYWQKNGEIPKVYTIDLSTLLVAVARQSGCLNEEDLAHLDDIRAELEHHRRGGMTDKNLALIRQVLSPGVWASVVNLPKALMSEARSQQDHAPIKAAVTAQIAVAIAILSVAPVRLGNLGRIRLGENLIKPGGLGSPYWLVFPDHDVKNRVRLEYPFDQVLTEMIDHYVYVFRPALVRGSNEPWLFPGEAGGFKTLTTLSDQVSIRIVKATGLRTTIHQFRHAAGAIILKNRPGEYELVRRLLGHRNIQTTINFYCGLETTQASETFATLVREHVALSCDRDDAPYPASRPRSRSKGRHEPCLP